MLIALTVRVLGAMGLSCYYLPANKVVIKYNVFKPNTIDDLRNRTEDRTTNRIT